MWHSIPQQAVYDLIMIAIAFMLGRVLGASPHRDAARKFEELAARNEEFARENRQQCIDATQRAQSLQRLADQLERTITDFSDIAERLTAERDPRKIPELALELVEEVFAPSYSLFYQASRGGFVLVAKTGTCEFRVGHRTEATESPVRWAAQRQILVAPDDLHYGTGMVRAEGILDSAVPAEGFSFCLPIMGDGRALGVIVIGSCQRNERHGPELGRTIALMSGVSITSSLTLREQKRLAKTDGLTGLLNKTHILNCAQAALAAEERTRRSVSIFLFDIDHFKNFNDTNGHLPGDQLLKNLSALLKQGLRECEYIGRYGGEEFLMVLPGVEKGEALKAAERVRATIAEHHFEHGERQPLGHVSISGGVASWPDDGDDVESLVIRADEALYRAKKEGRDAVFAADSPGIEPTTGDPLADTLAEI